MNQFNPYQNNNYRPYLPPTQNGIIWVQGIEGAKAYQLAPNSNAMLLDSENDGIFYIKIADNVGMCNLRTFQYKETTNTPTATAIDTSQFVTRDELNNLIAELKGGLRNEQSVQSTARAKGSKQFIAE